MIPYPPQIEQLILSHHRTLSERERRHHAAMEASKLGHGGIRYMSRLLRMSRDTIHKGIKEVSNLLLTDQNSDSNSNIPPTNRQRRPGGGRKKNTAPAKSIADRPDRDSQGR